MSLMVKFRKINLEGEDMYCVIDMRTIATYKRITGESFLKGIQKIAEMDEEVILNLLASSLRYDVDGEPVGVEFLNKYNPIALLTNTIDMLVELIEDALPKTTPGEVKKKRTTKK